MLSAISNKYGKTGRFDAADVITLVIALAGAWVSAPDALRQRATKDTNHKRDVIAGVVHVLTAAAQPTKKE